MAFKKIIAHLIFCCLLFGAQQVQAQFKLNAASIVTEEDGLLDDRVRCFTKTEDGFMWIGTGSGLCRFDGVRFKHFVNDPLDETSLYDNRIQNLVLSDGKIWIATHVGFSAFDTQTEQFKNYQIQNCQFRDSLTKNSEFGISGIAKSRDGDIWLGSKKGLYQYNVLKDSIICYQPDYDKVLEHFPHTLSVNRIMSIQQDRFQDSIMWAGSASGLWKINTSNQQVDWFFHPDKEEKEVITKNVFRQIYQHEDGKIYSSSWNGGVNVFDPILEQFSSLVINNITKEEQEMAKFFVQSPTKSIVQKSKNEIWISGSKGLMEYNSESEKWQRIYWNEHRESVIYGVNFIDPENRIWFNTNDGIFIFDPIRQQFSEYNFEKNNPKGGGFSYYFLPGEREEEITVLARSSDGLFHINTKERGIEKIPFPQSVLDDDDLIDPRGLSMRPNGDWTIVSHDYLINFNPVTKTFNEMSFPEELKSNNLLSVLWDKKGRLWIGSTGVGLSRWTPETNQWERLTSFLETPTTKAGSVSKLFEDSQGNIWMRRRNGMSVYSSKGDDFYNFINVDGAPKIVPYFEEITEDQSGRVWFSAVQGMLIYADAFNPQKGIINKHDLSQAIPENEFYYLDSGPNGKLWVLGFQFLIQIDPDDLNFKKYNLKYGIDKNDFFGFKVLESGKIVIGGKNKIWYADPNDLQPNAEIPRPYLTAISILEQPLETDSSITQLSSLELKHWQNFFSFDFSAIGFTVGDENQFKYQLEGFNENWINAGDRRNVNYTNVPPGNYVFKLKAANNEGIWNEEVYSLPVSIDRPWWGTIWFYVLAGLLITIIAIIAYRFRVRQILKEQHIKADFDKRILEVEMNALRAQMNPHFLFNCLNSIERYIIINETRKASEYLNDFARLIRLILQNSRSNYVRLSDELEALELYVQMEAMRFRNKFKYEIRKAPSLDTERLDVPPMLIQPYVENAIWHGLMHKEDKNNALVLIDINRQNGYLVFVIEDNGIGREKAQQIKARKLTKGKESVGMKITGDRIKMINELYNSNTSVEIIDLKDEKGIARGTRVVLKIPV